MTTIAAPPPPAATPTPASDRIPAPDPAVTKPSERQLQLREWGATSWRNEPKPGELTGLLVRVWDPKQGRTSKLREIHVSLHDEKAHTPWTEGTWNEHGTFKHGLFGGEKLIEHELVQHAATPADRERAARLKELATASGLFDGPGPGERKADGPGSYAVTAVKWAGMGRGQLTELSSWSGKLSDAPAPMRDVLAGVDEYMRSAEPAFTKDEEAFMQERSRALFEQEKAALPPVGGA